MHADHADLRPPVEPCRTSSSGQAVIRPIERTDKEAVCERLASAFPATPRDAWPLLFDYPWHDPADDFGVLAELDGEIVGICAVIHSRRIVRGKLRRFTNGLGWWVDPTKRRLLLGRRLIETAIARYGADTKTFLTTRPDHAKFWRHFPLVPFEDHRYFVPARPRLRIGPNIDRVLDAEVTPSMVGDDAYRIWSDHRSLRCESLVFRDGSSACVVVARRRVIELPPSRLASRIVSAYPVLERFLRPRIGDTRSPRLLRWGRDLLAGRIPTAEIMYVSDREFASRHLHLLIAQLARITRSVGAIVEERRIPFDNRGYRHVPGHYYAMSPDLGPEDIDALYSEIVLLPM